MEELNKNTLELETDFIISVGEACRPVHYIKKYGLRQCANPFDWMMGYSLDTFINLLNNDFCDFFKFHQELPLISKTGFRSVEDTKNKIISIHSFPFDKDLDLAYKEFFELMSNRYYRMKKAIFSSDNVLFISNRREPMENYEYFLKELQKMFKCNFTYLNIRDNENKEEKKYIRTKILNKNLKIIEYGFYDKHQNGSTPQNPDFWKGNSKEWDNVMSHIKLSTKLTQI